MTLPPLYIYTKKPLLRGAQKGVYWNGSAEVPATRFCDDFNWDTSGEYTNTNFFAVTFDTTNGYLRLSYGPVLPEVLKINTIQGSDFYATYNAMVESSAGLPYIPGLVFCWDGTTTPTKSFVNNAYILTWYKGSAPLLIVTNSAGSQTTIGTGTKPLVENTKYIISILKVGSSIKVYIDDALEISVTNSALSSGYFGFWGYGNSYHGRVFSVNLNLLESTGTNGTAIGICGIAHGGLWGDNWVGQKFTKDVFGFTRDYACAAKYGLSTKAGEAFTFYFRNTTDDTAILASGGTTKTEITATGAAYATFNTPELALRVQDNSDEIFLGIIKNVAGDTPPIYLTDLTLALVPIVPALTTEAVTDITPASIHIATANGTLLDNGGAIATRRGVCYGLTSLPTVADSVVYEDAAGGWDPAAFTESLVGLIEGTKYYLRAYAVNSVGTGYGSVVDFTTLFPAEDCTLSIIQRDVTLEILP